MAVLTDEVVGLVEVMVRPLLDHPDELRIEGSQEENGTVVVTMRVNEGDAGKVIGRQGRVIKAIRTLARASASREGAQVEVELLD